MAGHLHGAAQENSLATVDSFLLKLSIGRWYTSSQYPSYDPGPRIVALRHLKCWAGLD